MAELGENLWLRQGNSASATRGMVDWWGPYLCPVDFTSCGTFWPGEREREKRTDARVPRWLRSLAMELPSLSGRASIKKKPKEWMDEWSRSSGDFMYPTTEHRGRVPVTSNIKKKKKKEDRVTRGGRVLRWHNFSYVKYLRLVFKVKRFEFESLKKVI